MRNDVVLTTWVTSELKQEIEAACIKHDLTKAQFVRRAVKNYLEHVLAQKGDIYA